MGLREKIRCQPAATPHAIPDVESIRRLESDLNIEICYIAYKKFMLPVKNQSLFGRDDEKIQKENC